jgi:hypothetical protein
VDCDQETTTVQGADIPTLGFRIRKLVIIFGFERNVNAPKKLTEEEV